MKKIITIILASILLILTLAGCNKTLTTENCRVIRDDDNYVTYQTVCDNCGYEYADPKTVHVSNTGSFRYSIVCPQCLELMYILIERN